MPTVTNMPLGPNCDECCDTGCGHPLWPREFNITINASPEECRASGCDFGEFFTLAPISGIMRTCQVPSCVGEITPDCTGLPVFGTTCCCYSTSKVFDEALVAAGCAPLPPQQRCDCYYNDPVLYGEFVDTCPEFTQYGLYEYSKRLNAFLRITTSGAVVSYSISLLHWRKFLNGTWDVCATGSTYCGGTATIAHQRPTCAEQLDTGPAWARTSGTIDPPGVGTFTIS